MLSKHIDRRGFLVGAGMALPMLGATAFAQTVPDEPKLIVLPKGITSQRKNPDPRAAKRDFSLEGWLLCNGALAPKDRFPKLFDEIGFRFGASADKLAFRLPREDFAIGASGDIRGIAICPESRIGSDVGDLAQFDTRANL